LYTIREKKKTFAMLALSHKNFHFSHICLYRTLAKTLAKLCNINEAKKIANILFLRCKFFTIEMEEENDMLVDIKKVKALVDHL